MVGFLDDTADISMICEDDLLALLTSIRWDALPLIEFLSRLEETPQFDLIVSKYTGTCENQLSVQLEDEHKAINEEKKLNTPVSVTINTFSDWLLALKAR
ncbi:unnamed protein product [Trichobilharzia regenti]|nr:unnamed protein product [Trichobilharzia regenti]